MKNKFFKQRSFYAVFLSVVLSVVLVAGAAGAATTISSNINTGGTLTVSGISSLADSLLASSTAVIDGVAEFKDQLILDRATSDPTGVAAGALYFDTGNNLIRVYDGAAWNTVATSTSASQAGGDLILASVGSDATLENMIRLKDIGTGLMALGTTSPVLDSGTITHLALLTVQATSSTNVPLRIINASSTFSEANLFEVLGGDSSELFVIDSLGHASSTSGLTLVGGSGSFIASASSTFSSTLFVNGLNTLEGGFISNGSSTLTSTLHIEGLFTASSSVVTDSLTVGNAVSGTAIDRIFAGTCSTEALTGQYTFTASTSATYVHCQNATGVTAGDKVMVTSSSSLPVSLVITGASSTDTNAISILIHNTGFGSTTVNAADELLTTPGEGTTTVVLFNARDNNSNVVTFDFWAFR